MSIALDESKARSGVYTEEVEPGVFVIRNIEVERGVASRFLGGLSFESKTLLGWGEDRDRQRRRIRSISERMEDAPLQVRHRAVLP